jgi:hypothetical protein
VPEALAQFVATRRQCADGTGGMFDTLEQELPGSVYGLTERSIYEDLNADVIALLNRTAAGPCGRPYGMCGCGREIGLVDGADKSEVRAGTKEAMNVGSCSMIGLLPTRRFTWA